MQRQRQEIIDQLKRDGIFEMQKELSLPTFCQRIAVISSATAAGFGDFTNHLQGNEHGFKFTTELFPAIMQGEQVEPSVINALNNINDRIDEFDCVVIIRGGGATADMSGFNTLALAENGANFPLPIITGRGHDRDESIIDMISFMQVKTPTAAAGYLIDHLQIAADRIAHLADSAARCVQEKLERERIHLTSISTRIPILFSLTKTREQGIIDSLQQRIINAVQQDTKQRQYRIEHIKQRLTPAAQNIIQQQKHRLQLIEKIIEGASPMQILQRGYSITRCDGRVVRESSALPEGSVLTTELADGMVKSVVIVD
jgi:exodeoxyribonuclease VII large subunit